MEVRDRIKELRRVRVGDVVPHPRNWRTHPSGQADALRGVLAEVGIADALLARQLDDGRLQLIDGHLRRDLDPDQTWPVLVLDVTEEEARKLLVTIDPLAGLAEADQQALGELLAQIETESGALQAMLEGLAEEHGIDMFEEAVLDDPGPQIDRAAELQEKWQVKRGQLWLVEGKAGVHRVLCGDSTKEEDVGRAMGGKEITVVYADPPYGIGLETDYCKRYGNPKSRSEAALYGDDKGIDIKSFLRIVEGIAEVFVWGAENYPDALPRGGSWFVWDKSVPAVDGIASDFELCWSKTRHHYMMIRKLWKGAKAREEMGQETQKIRWPHPTQKPVDLASYILGKYSKPSDVILDPFLGSGTTLVACEILGRIGIGLEIEPAYIAIILERMSGLGLTPCLIEEPAG